MATSTSSRGARETRTARPPSLALPGIVLGAGLGGFVDGILLHQILQWHHLLTSTNTDNIGVPYYPATTVHGLEINTLWDGIFHDIARSKKSRQLAASANRRLPR